jgi:two-component system, NtrC family, sensor kinase
MPKSKILVLEDDEKLGNFIRKCLERWDYEVVALVDTGQAAVDAAWNTLPDLALLDIFVPGGMDGVAAGTIIRKNLDIPIVFQTGSFDDKTLERAVQAEPLGYLLKPFNHLNLHTTIDNALYQHRMAQRRSRTALASVEKRFREMIDDSPLGICEVSIPGRLMSVNASLARILGYESAAALLQSVKNVGQDLFFEPEDNDALVLLLRQQIAVSSFESRFRRADGSTVLASIDARLIKNVSETEECYECVVQDVTARKSAEDALRESEERLRCLMNAARDGISMTDESGNVLLWSQATERITGYTAAEALGKNLNSLITPAKLRDEYQRAFERWLATAESDTLGMTVEAIGLRKDQTEFPMELSLSAVRQKGQWTSIGIIRDVTDRMRNKSERDLMEVMLRQSQKLESIGQLAAGIAHEINTPTQYVGDNTRFLMEAFSDVETVLKLYRKLLDACKCNRVSPGIIEEIEAELQSADLDYLSKEIPKAIAQSLDGIERIATIVRAMKDFSHPGSKDMVPINIHKAIENTLIVCRNEYKYVANVSTEFDESMPSVPCIPGDFNQVIMNLVINAAHAIADKLGPQPTSKGFITISTYTKDNKAEIRVSDTGAGIPEDIRARVYDPFFTTKDIGKGTGQGLAICHAVIVQKHGGSITFESEVGCGTAFIIRLPLEGKGSDVEAA